MPQSQAKIGENMIKKLALILLFLSLPIRVYSQAIWTPSQLDDLDDITISSPADGEVLTYEAATSMWKNLVGGAGGVAGAAGNVNTLQFHFPSGTMAGAPLIVTKEGKQLSIGSFNTNPNAQLFISTGTNNAFALRIADTAGVDKLVVTHSGNLGIGLTNPSVKLQVSGTGRMSNLFISGRVGIETTAPDALLTVGVPEATTENAPIATFFNAGAARLVFRDTTNDIETVWGASTARAILATYTNHPIEFRTNNNAANSMWLFTTGNLGVSGNIGAGLTNPSYKLHVAGTAAAQTLRFGTLLDNILPAGTGAADYVIISDGAGVLSWAAQSGSGGVQSVTATLPIVSSGGTAPNMTLSYNVDTLGTTAAGFLILKAGTGTSGQMLLGNMTWANTSAGGSGTLTISGTTPSGNVRVLSGNTLAGDTLIVSDGSNLSVGIGTTGNSARVYVRGSGTNANMNLRVADSLGADKLVILDNGNVGIGTTAPAGKLDIRGAGTGVGIGLDAGSSPKTKLHIKSSSTAAAQGLYIEDGVLCIKSGNSAACMVLTISGGTVTESWLVIASP